MSLLDKNGNPIRASGLNDRHFFNTGLSNGAANLDSPTLSSWQWRGGSPDDDIIRHLPVVRQRCRDLALNAPIVAGILNTIVTNVVGIGLVPEPTPDWHALGLSEFKSAGRAARLARADE